MNFFVGLAIVVVCILGSYALEGGKLSILLQPLELVIIGGSSLGGVWIGNTSVVRSHAFSSFKYVISGSPYTGAVFLDVLKLLTAIFKLMRTKGNLALESHIEDPNNSVLFQKYPLVLSHKKVVTFLCDYLRVITMGTEDPMQIEDLLNEELETKHQEHHLAVNAIEKMADAFPAMGIVAAVLGVIKAMGAINQSPEILGEYIGAALVGTFLGVLLSYALVGPMAQCIALAFKQEHMLYECIKIALLSHLHNNPPVISIEFARKKITSDIRPNFSDIEEMVLES